MEPTTWMEGVLGVAAKDGLHRAHRATRDHRPCVVHAVEGRVVAARPDARLGWAKRIGRQAPNRGDVARGVGEQEIFVRRGLRGDARLGTNRSQEIDPRSEPARSQRMGWPEVIRRRQWTEDEQRAVCPFHHVSIVTWQHDDTVERVYSTPLLDKLGVKPGIRVAVINVDDPDFLNALGERTSDVTMGPPLPGTDLVFLGADTLDELERIAVLRSALVPNGAIWVVSRKGKAATLRDIEVIDAAKSVGLVDNKVASFSATHTALRLVIPVALRKEMS